jgi:histidinol-phosphate aminotransferase
MSALDTMHVAYVPSHGNFLLVRVGDGARVYDRLLRQGVIVRPVANYGLPEHVRVTVGLPEENRRFLAALESALGR